MILIETLFKDKRGSFIKGDQSLKEVESREKKTVLSKFSLRGIFREELKTIVIFNLSDVNFEID